jgi:hypothetical protein
VNPDVTFHIYIGSGGAVSSQDMVQSAAAAEAPPPLPLDQLQVGGAQIAPAPLSPEGLSAVRVALPVGPAPAPMAIEQLQATTVAIAPEPQPLGTLEGVGGAPMPRSPEELGAVMAAPEPLAPEQLGSPSVPNPEKPGGRKGSHN